MSVTTQTQQEISSGLLSRIPDGARVLVVNDDDSDARLLRALLLGGGFASDCANTITTGCDAAKSGKFQVVVATPQLKDGSWRRLSDIASHYDLHFEIVLWAYNFDLREWAEALDSGAFDVLDAVNERSRVVEATKCAFWAAYLKGAGPNPRMIRPHKAA
jgi:DNA-binding NtrC family response regulator